MRETRERLNLRGIDWLPIGYHQTPRIPATLFDIANGWRRGAALGRRSRAQVVHARTFVGGLIGHAVAKTLRIPFIYHNEGFYPDEQVDAGVWKAGSVMHRVAKTLESHLYARAAGIIVLSQRARESVCARGEVRRKGTPVIVVPSAIDVDRFRPRSFAPLGQHPLRLVYLGGVGGRYRLDAVARFAAIVCRQHPCHLQVYTTQPDRARRILQASCLRLPEWSVSTVTPGEVPSALASRDAGLSFLVRGLSEHGGSPTKVGEYWASGIPVITTSTVGDVGDVIRREGVGVIVAGEAEQAYAQASTRLLTLLEDPELPARCRRAAETHYSVAPAAGRQVLLYERLLGRRVGVSP
jgi:glycosyltransferase involved in cell wall biosynthesis